MVLQSGRLHTHAWWLYVVFGSKLLAPSRARLLKDTLWWIAVLATWENSENDPQQFPLLSAHSFWTDPSRASVIVSDVFGPDGFGYYHGPLGSETPHFGASPGTARTSSSIRTAASSSRYGSTMNAPPPRPASSSGLVTTRLLSTASTRALAGQRMASLFFHLSLLVAMPSASYSLLSRFLENSTVSQTIFLTFLFLLSRTSPAPSLRTLPTLLPPRPLVSWTTPSSQPSPTQTVSTPAVWNKLCRAQEAAAAMKSSATKASIVRAYVHACAHANLRSFPLSEMSISMFLVQHVMRNAGSCRSLGIYQTALRQECWIKLGSPQGNNFDSTASSKFFGGRIFTLSSGSSRYRSTISNGLHLS